MEKILHTNLRKRKNPTEAHTRGIGVIRPSRTSRYDRPCVFLPDSSDIESLCIKRKNLFPVKRVTPKEAAVLFDTAKITKFFIIEKGNLID